MKGEPNPMDNANNPDLETPLTGQKTSNAMVLTPAPHTGTAMVSTYLKSLIGTKIISKAPATYTQSEYPVPPESGDLSLAGSLAM